MKDSILFDDCRKFTEIAIEKLLEVISIAVSYKLGKFKDRFTGWLHKQSSYVRLEYQCELDRKVIDFGTDLASYSETWTET